MSRRPSPALEGLHTRGRDRTLIPQRRGLKAGRGVPTWWAYKLLDSLSERCGALWRAEPVEEGARIEPGYTVRVISVEGLTLRVRPVEDRAEQNHSEPAATERAKEGVR